MVWDIHLKVRCKITMLGAPLNSLKLPQSTPLVWESSWRVPLLSDAMRCLILSGNHLTALPNTQYEEGYVHCWRYWLDFSSPI